MTDLVDALETRRDPDEAEAEPNAGESSASQTTMPEIVATPVAPNRLRTLSGMSRSDYMNLGGAVLSSLSITFLLFGILAPLSGGVGFVLVAWVMFLVVYGLLVSLDESRPVVVDKVMSAVMLSAALVAGIALVSVILYTLWEGREVLFRANFYTDDMSSAGPLDPLSVGGIGHAIVGTLIIIGIAIAITVPLGLATAVFLNEVDNRFSRFVRTVVDAMTALPSILAGLFIFATWILILGFERSGLAAAIATSIMMLPIIIRSADVVLRLVPGNLKEASYALGAPTYRTVGNVTLPTARSGLATAVILGIARGIGETAPVLLTAGFTGTLNTDPLHNPMVTLSLSTFYFVKSPQEALIQRGFATAAVLMILVLVLFAIARFLGGRQPGQLSNRQAKRIRARSRKDLARFEAAHVADDTHVDPAPPPAPTYAGAVSAVSAVSAVAPGPGPTAQASTFPPPAPPGPVEETPS
jgi:phosphate transport system permease protein